MKKIIFLGLATTVLTGCIYKDPKPTKISGINQDIMMDQVDHMYKNGDIDMEDGPYLGDGYLGGEEGDDTNSPKKKKLPDQVYGLLKSSTDGYQVATPSAGQPVRYAEQVQKIYIFPYRDKYGNFYDSQIMYAILNKSHWVDYPVKQIETERYDFSAIEE